MYRPDTVNVTSSFLLYALLSEQVRKNLLEKVGGSTVGHAKVDDIRFLTVPLPSMEEQRAIAAALSDADEWIARLDRLIAKKRDIKQAAMQQLLTGKTRLPGFKGAWTIATLRDVCGFENGDRGGNYPSKADFTEGGYAFINAGHVRDGKIDKRSLDFITKEKYDSLGGGKFFPGDILFCLRGSLGKFGVVDGDSGAGAIASSLIIVRPRANVSPRFLVSYFKSDLCKKMIEKWAGGAAQPNLGGQDLARFQIYLPPTFEEQDAIGSAISDTDAEIDQLEAKRDKARSIKQGMMQELLTGRVRLI